METINVKKTSSFGYAIGPAFLYKKTELTADDRKIEPQEVDQEIENFEAAVKKADQELEALSDQSEIFAAQRELLNDFTLTDAVKAEIKKGNNMQMAAQNSISQLVTMFEQMEDEYLRERSADMKDILRRLLMVMQGVDSNPFASIEEPAIIVAEDLVPSDTANMDFDKVLGFLTEVGGDTSHVAIIARNKGIPCIVGVKGVMEKIEQGMPLILDAEDGSIVIDPDEETLNLYTKKQQDYLQEKKVMEEEGSKPSVTKDGRAFKLCANVGNIEDIKNALNSPIEGVGLFRTEFLYMEKKDAFPTEEEQFEIYKEAAELLDGKEVTIRTLDIGGDKGLDYFEFPPEDNPFLGYRAIRICLDQTDIFRDQLRALLRASAYGNIRIMYPMIMSIEELDQANQILEECKQELKKEGKAYNENVEVGMMIETPASVMLAEEFAKRVDFFSIGTNDLTQYMLAVDRGNEKIASLYNSFNPAVIRGINQVIQAAHKENTTVGMCGEFAGDRRASKLLLGMGLDEFSMSAGNVIWVKKILRDENYADAHEKALQALDKNYAQEIVDLFE